MLARTSVDSANQETRSWILVIVTILLAEVGMHEFGGFSLAWGVIFAAIIFAATTVALRNYRQLRTIPWLLVTPLLGLIGLSILGEGLGLDLLGDVDLTRFGDLFAGGPQHGLLAITHVLSDFSVIGIGIYQLVRWYRLRSSACALGAAAAFTACCGTTAALLAPAFASVLGVFGIHSGVSFVMIATILTLAVAALGYVWAGGIINSKAS